MRCRRLKVETHCAFLHSALSLWPPFALPSYVKAVCTAGTPWHTMLSLLLCMFVGHVQLNSAKGICMQREQSKCEKPRRMSLFKGDLTVFELQHSKSLKSQGCKGVACECEQRSWVKKYSYSWRSLHLRQSRLVAASSVSIWAGVCSVRCDSSHRRLLWLFSSITFMLESDSESFSLPIETPTIIRGELAACPELMLIAEARAQVSQHRGGNRAGERPTHGLL